MQRPALAVFVKTPELSPVKTRLAAEIGEHLARGFYELAVTAMSALLRHLTQEISACAYWAVAEPAGMSHARWEAWPRLAQGSGPLGDRLDLVYDALRQQHGNAILLGADAPHVRLSVLRDACRAVVELPEDRYLLGRADDGGFYLFAARLPISRDIWQAVPYSVEVTADKLVTLLAPRAQPIELPSLYDMDTLADWHRLATQETADPEWLPEQMAVWQFVRQHRVQNSAR